MPWGKARGSERTNHGRGKINKVQPVDEILPLPQLFLFGLQHVLVMAASPITAAFLVSRALNCTPSLTLNLISAAIIVFCVIAAMGIEILRNTDLGDHGNLFTLAAALAMGLLPILVPGVYSKFPQSAQLILGNGLAAGTLTAVLFNIIFRHLRAGTSATAATAAELPPASSSLP